MAVIGAGNVGQEVAKRFSAMDAYTVGFDIHTNATPYFNQMKLISTFVQHVNNFDVIVVTAPLLPSTKGLISRDVLISTKEGAILINIARGGLIDEQAMCDVLAQRKDLFVALDVFEEEPLSEKSSLWEFDNVAISPHNSFVSNKNNIRMFQVMYDHLKEFMLKQK